MDKDYDGYGLGWIWIRMDKNYDGYGLGWIRIKMDRIKIKSLINSIVEFS